LLISTVCDCMQETCPVFPGDPDRIHWSFADPTIVEDEGARRKAFEQTARELTTRIRYLLTLIEREKDR
jgi:ArsR family transcriptional regulator, arsenate/arsenite/antimonite-responsive transcriptional repressor / arsenate reductase (thioredoxin)